MHLERAMRVAFDIMGEPASLSGVPDVPAVIRVIILPPAEDGLRSIGWEAYLRQADLPLRVPEGALLTTEAGRSFRLGQCVPALQGGAWQTECHPT